MRDTFQRWLYAFSLAVCALLARAGDALAAGVVGEATPWALNFQPAYSPVMERVHEFHTMLLVIISGIVLLVLGILTFIIFRFNSRANPTPSKTAHNTVLEVVWTAVPILILVVIALPSIRLLYYANKAPEYDLTLKVTGHQWYWSYAYPDHEEITFDSIPVPSDALQSGQPRLLSVDNPVVVPVGATVRVLVNSDDVIHNWAVPSLGLKKDATPGRTNETWFRVDQEGVFYGMCSELCGVNHYFMPIEIRAVSKEAFDSWVAEAKEKFAVRDDKSVKMASSAASTR